MQDTLWYAPLDPAAGPTVPLVSAYGGGNELQAAQPFTVSLVSVYLASEHLRRIGWLERVLQARSRCADLQHHDTRRQSAS